MPEATLPTILDHLVPATHRAHPARDGMAPSTEQMDQLLRAAVAVPDHGGLRPWRFAVVAGEARHRLGEAFVADATAGRPDAPGAMIDKARGKAFAAPALVVLIASPRPGSKVPVWEQVASASCCGYAIVLAAGALGLGAVWKSAPFCDGAALARLLALAEGEQVLGWVNVGTPEDTTPSSRDQAPEPAALTTYL